MRSTEILKTLMDWFKGKGKVAVAFSGGLDSSLVAAAAAMTLGEGALAITVKTELIGKKEVEDAKATAKKLGIRHKIIELNLPKLILENPPERCYICKKHLMKNVRETACKDGFGLVVDGTNIDDIAAVRPGTRALEEEGIRSPLTELKLGKQEVRQFLKMLGFDYTKAPNACLATRFTIGHRITSHEISMVEEAEEFLRENGFNLLRVRFHDGMARIEIGKDELPRLFSGNLFEKVAVKLKSLGFTHVTVDLEGYRAGNMDQKH